MIDRSMSIQESLESHFATDIGAQWSSGSSYSPLLLPSYHSVERVNDARSIDQAQEILACAAEINGFPCHRAIELAFVIHSSAIRSIVPHPVIIPDVKMYDYSSFYPWVMAQMPPLTKGEWVKPANIKTTTKDSTELPDMSRIVNGL